MALISDQVGIIESPLKRAVSVVAGAFVAMAVLGSPLIAEWALRIPEEPEALINQTVGYDDIDTSPALQGFLARWGTAREGVIELTSAWRSMLEPIGLTLIYDETRLSRDEIQGFAWPGREAIPTIVDQDAPLQEAPPIQSDPP